jgi:hypothetical protein
VIDVKYYIFNGFDQTRLVRLVSLTLTWFFFK